MSFLRVSVKSLPLMLDCTSDPFVHCLYVEQGTTFLLGGFVDLPLEETYLYNGGLINY